MSVYNCSNRILNVSNSVINGSNNDIIGNNNVINGSNNDIIGNNNVINGSNNNIKGNNNNIKGNNNVAKGSNNIVIGNNNKSTSTGGSYNFGYFNDDIVINNFGSNDDIVVSGLDGFVVNGSSMTFNNYPGSRIINVGSNNEVVVNGRRAASSVPSVPAVVVPNINNLPSVRKIELVLNGTDTETDEEGRSCTICLENVRCVMVDCCNGVPYCVSCTKKICYVNGSEIESKEVGEVSCPLCRKNFTSAKRFFL